MSRETHLIKIFPETDLTDIHRIELNAVRELLLRSTWEKEAEAKLNRKRQTLIAAMDHLLPWEEENAAEPNSKKPAVLTSWDHLLPRDEKTD